MSNKIDTDRLLSETRRRLAGNIALSANLKTVMDSNDNDANALLTELCTEISNNPNTATVEAAHALAVYTVLIAQTMNSPEDVSVKESMGSVVNLVTTLLMLENNAHAVVIKGIAG